MMKNGVNESNFWSLLLSWRDLTRLAIHGKMCSTCAYAWNEDCLSGNLVDAIVKEKERFKSIG